MPIDTMQIFLIPFIFFLTSCASQATEPQPMPEEINNLPITCDGAAEKILDELDTDSVQTLKQTKREDLIQFHFSWGMGIRNSFSLWDEQSQIRRSCAESVGQGDVHPDNASSIIMDKVWALVHGSM